MFSNGEKHTCIHEDKNEERKRNNFYMHSFLLRYKRTPFVDRYQGFII